MEGEDETFGPIKTKDIIKTEEYTLTVASNHFAF